MQRGLHNLPLIGMARSARSVRRNSEKDMEPNFDNARVSRQKKRVGLLGVFLGGLMLVSLAGESLGTAEAAWIPDSYYIQGVPLYSQVHNLSCEFAAAKMVT